MQLYLIRHGEAEEGKSDSDRALTPAGKKDAEKMSKRLSALPNPPIRIFSSPLLRARETAAPFGLGWALKTELADWLLPLSPVSQVFEELAALNVSSIALVGHLPHLGLLLSAMTQGLPAQELPLPRGSVSLLEIDAWKPAGGRLQWLLTPDGRGEDVSLPPL